MRVALLGYVENTEPRELVMINIDTTQIVRITVDSVIQTLKNGKRILGLDIVNNKLKVQHGDIKDYVRYIDIKETRDEYSEDAQSQLYGLRLAYRSVSVFVEKVHSINGIIHSMDIIGPDGERAVGLIPTRYNHIKHINGKIEDGKFIDYYNTVTYEDKTEEIAKITGIDKYKANSIKNTVRKLPASQSRFNDIDKKYDMTLIEKITASMLGIKAVRPFYYSSLTILNRVETLDIPTMGVTIDTLYINPNFAMEVSIHEMNFILMHEICHIVMMHRSRQGKRIHKIWNIACDAYVNKFVVNEIGANNPGDTVKLANGKGKNIGFTVPKDLVWMDIDLNTDTPESIYNELIKDNNIMKMYGSNSGSGDGEENNSNQVGSNSNGEENDSNGGGSCGGGDIVKNGKYEADIVEDGKSSKMTEEQIKQAQKILNRRIKQRAVQDKSIGSQAGDLFRVLDETLVEKVDWKKVFRRMLSKRYEIYNSYVSPDRRFIGRGKVLPGPVKSEENGVTKVHIYIDTSGSIQDKDLYIALKQAQDLMKSYNATAIVNFWDTKVYSEVETEFTEPNDIMKVKPKGGGGTDINCVFAYESNRYTKKDGNTDIILVWTDGYYGDINEKFYKPYGNKTVFIVNEDTDFEPKMGKKAYFKRN